MILMVFSNLNDSMKPPGSGEVSYEGRKLIKPTQGKHLISRAARAVGLGSAWYSAFQLCQQASTRKRIFFRRGF